MAKAKKKEKIGMGRAIVALCINIFLLPGLGSIIGGKKKDGVNQLILFIVGIPAMMFLIGFPMIIAAWIWGIVTGAFLIADAQE